MSEVLGGESLLASTMNDRVEQSAGPSPASAHSHTLAGVESTGGEPSSTSPLPGCAFKRFLDIGCPVGWLPALGVPHLRNPGGEQPQTDRLRGLAPKAAPARQRPIGRFDGNGRLANDDTPYSAAYRRTAILIARFKDCTGEALMESHAECPQVAKAEPLEVWGA